MSSSGNYSRDNHLCLLRRNCSDSDFDFGVKQTSDFQSNLLQSIEKQNIHILGKSSFESRKTNDRARSELKCA